MNGVSNRRNGQNYKIYLRSRPVTLGIVLAVEQSGIIFRHVHILCECLDCHFVYRAWLYMRVRLRVSNLHYLRPFVRPHRDGSPSPGKVR